MPGRQLMVWMLLLMLFFSMFHIASGLLYFLVMRQMRAAGRGAMSFGKSRAKMLAREKNRTTFEDVAGVDEAREEVQEIVEFLKAQALPEARRPHPQGRAAVGPAGHGQDPAGQGHRRRGECAVFQHQRFGLRGDVRRRRRLARARHVRAGKKNAPCIIFIDEIDAVGRSRFSGIGGGHDEREQTLNALLVEMDGFDTQEGIIIIAATNRPDVLDPALLRPGRFDRQITVDLPTLDGRDGSSGSTPGRSRSRPGVDLRRIARGTPGFSGADLANLINEAALLAARRGAEAVEMPDLEEARDKVRWGRERRSRLLDDKESA
jgi:cell division protease FtsH